MKSSWGIRHAKFGESEEYGHLKNICGGKAHMESVKKEYGRMGNMGTMGNDNPNDTIPPIQPLALMKPYCNPTVTLAKP